jgi:uncharacterized membrane protein
MKEMTILGRTFIAIAMIAFGIQHFVYLELVTRVFPALPLWLPYHSIFACFFGVFLCATGVAILFQTKAWTMTLLLAGAILLMFAIFLLPFLVMNPTNGFMLTNAGKALVLAGANLLVAGTFSPDALTGSRAKIMNALARLIPLGKCFLVGFFILAACLHFVYAEFVAMLIPAWIPAHLFWTYFAAVALIAGGIGMLVPKTAQLAATLSAIMVFSWVVLLHAPRALANLHDSNETTAFFEALTMCGMAIIIAVNARRKNNK